MNETTLKLPGGSFSHSDLAIANGKTNQQIWAEYSRLRKEGIIVSAGTRSTGKGKPTSLWKVADGQPVPIVKVAPVPVVKVEPVKPTLVVVTETAIVVEPLPVVVPTEAPVVTETVEVVQVAPPAPVVRNLTCQVTEIEQKCPICKHPMLSINNATGITVWCSQPKEICYPNENVYGHGRNINEAYETACDKFKWV